MTEQHTTVPEYTHLLDAQGLKCPEPVMLLHSKVREMQVGDVVKILATDPSTARDFVKFCQFLGHKMCHTEETDTLYTFYIEKGERKPA